MKEFEYVADTKYTEEVNLELDTSLRPFPRSFQVKPVFCTNRESSPTPSSRIPLKISLVYDKGESIEEKEVEQFPPTQEV